METHNTYLQACPDVIWIHIHTRAHSNGNVALVLHYRLHDVNIDYTDNAWQCFYQALINIIYNFMQNLR